MLQVPVVLHHTETEKTVVLVYVRGIISMTGKIHIQMLKCLENGYILS